MTRASRSCSRSPSILGSCAVGRKSSGAFMSTHSVQTVRARGRFQKRARDREEFGLIEQECIVPLVGGDFGKGNARAAGVQRMHHGARLGAWEQPIARK